MCRWKSESVFQYILAKQLYLKNICIPNVSMYTPGKREYEADFIYFNLKSKRLTEVEIKINKIDFQYDNIRERSINARLIVFDKKRNEERPLFINVTYDKYNQVYNINYDYIKQLSVDFISMKNHLNNNNEFRNILLTVI